MDDELVRRFDSIERRQERHEQETARLARSVSEIREKVFNGLSEGVREMRVFLKDVAPNLLTKDQHGCIESEKDARAKAYKDGMQAAGSNRDKKLDRRNKLLIAIVTGVLGVVGTLIATGRIP